MTDFNPETFLSTEIEGNFSSDMLTLPEGEYEAFIEAVEARAVNLRDGSQQPILEVSWRIATPQIIDMFKDERGILARQSIWLKTTDGTLTGPLDKDHNQQLARLRDALDQNKADQRWAPSMLMGQSARVIAVTRDGQDKFEGQKFYEVKRVSAL